MAIFNRKKKENPKIIQSDNKEKEVSSVVAFSRNTIIVRNPRITEKGTLKAESSNAYTFDVSPEATKSEIKKSIQKMYNVTPVKINVLRVPNKSVSYRGRGGLKKGGRKAYVYLKKGDKIEFV